MFSILSFNKLKEIFKGWNSQWNENNESKRSRIEGLGFKNKIKFVRNHIGYMVCKCRLNGWDS